MILSPDLNILNENRKYIYSLVSHLPDEKMLTIPEGFQTHILWQLGHLVASQQILHYNLSGLKSIVDETFLSLFRKGSSPITWNVAPSREYVVSTFLTLPEKLAKDYNDKLFVNFNNYKTSAGVVLNNIDDSLAYNNFHEGIHTGQIQCLLKFL